MLTKMLADCSTGAVVEFPLDDDEIAQRELDAATLAPTLPPSRDEQIAATLAEGRAAVEAASSVAEAQAAFGATLGRLAEHFGG